MEQQKIRFIIKATSTPTSRPDYYAAADESSLREMTSFLRDDWHRVEWREVTDRNDQLEAFLRKCELGSERRRVNLQTYYNMQKGA